MNEKIPKRRFKEFEKSEAWEQRKLGDVVQITMGQSPNSENYTDNPNDYILVQGNADMKNGRVVPRVWTTQVTKEAKKNDLILSVRAPVGDIGKTDYSVVIGRGVAAVQGNDFIYQQLGKMKSNGYWNRYSTGSTFESINTTDIKEANILMPNIQEQEKIGSFFHNLDNTITLQERKIEKLKKLKLAYLTELFPDGNHRKPNKRFVNFAEAWEQRKLGDNARILTGGTPKTSIISYWEPKEIPWMSSGEVNKHRLNNTNNMISEEGLNNSSARWIKKNSILIALAGQGKTRATVAINNIPLTTNQSIAAIETSEKLYYEFVYQNLNKRYDELRMISSGDGTRGGLNKKIISEIIIACPKIEEQQKIGNFFKQLDETITLQERKLKKLKDLKLAYLNEMFV